jgi:hypothetical protein
MTDYKYTMSVTRQRESNGDVYYFYAILMDCVEVYKHNHAYLSKASAESSGLRKLERMQAVTV